MSTIARQRCTFSNERGLPRRRKSQALRSLSTWPTSRPRPAARRSGASPRSSACAAWRRPTRRAPAGDAVAGIRRAARRRHRRHCGPRRPAGRQGLTPFDRVSALAFDGREQAHCWSRSTRRPCWPSRSRIKVVGAALSGLAFGHTLVEVGALAEATVVLEQNGSVTLGDNVEVLVGDGAQLRWSRWPTGPPTPSRRST